MERQYQTYNFITVVSLWLIWVVTCWYFNFEKNLPWQCPSDCGKVPRFSIPSLFLQLHWPRPSVLLDRRGLQSNNVNMIFSWIIVIILHHCLKVDGTYLSMKHIFHDFYLLLRPTVDTHYLVYCYFPYFILWHPMTCILMLPLINLQRTGTGGP